MSTIAIDLTKNPELAALVADKEIGDWIELRASIKSLDEQTVTVRWEECEECETPESDDEMDDEPMHEKAEKTEEPAEKPGKSLARKLAPSSGY